MLYLCTHRTTHIELFLGEENTDQGAGAHSELSWFGDIETCKAGHEEEIAHTLEELEIESDVITQKQSTSK